MIFIFCKHFFIHWGAETKLESWKIKNATNTLKHQSRNFGIGALVFWWQRILFFNASILLLMKILHPAFQ